MADISERIRRLRELLAQDKVGPLRYWPTHFAGTIPTIQTDNFDVLFRAVDAERPFIGDRAVAVAQLLTEGRNSLLPLLEYIDSLERVREACQELTDILTNSTADNMARLREVHNKCLAALCALGVPITPEEE